MIRFALDYNFNGICEERQLFPHIQTIIANCHDNFEGKTSSSNRSLDGWSLRQIITNKMGYNVISAITEIRHYMCVPELMLVTLLKFLTIIVPPQY